MNTSRTLRARSARAATYTAVARFPVSPSATAHTVALFQDLSTHAIHAPTNANPAYRSTSVVIPHRVPTMSRSPAARLISRDDTAMSAIKPHAHAIPTTATILAPDIKRLLFPNSSPSTPARMSNATSGILIAP